MHTARLVLNAFRFGNLLLLASCLACSARSGGGSQSTGGSSQGIGGSSASAGGGGDAGGSTGGSPSGGASAGGAGGDSGSAGSGASAGAAGAGGGAPGELPCDRAYTYTNAGRSYAACESVVDGLSVKFFPLALGKRATHLAVHLHGDTANGWYSDWAFDPDILDWAQARDILVLGPLARTHYDGDTSPAYGAAWTPEGEAIATMLETFIDTYGASPELTYYWGISGGSWMMSSTFIAHVGQRVPGVFVANCGGDDVCAGGGINVGGCWSWDPRMDLATRDKISILYNYGSDDFLAGPSHTGYLKFQSLGFSVQEQIHQGATHCNHPIAGPTISFWEQQTP